MNKRTPRSRIRGYLRQIFLKSIERGEAIKRDKYTCQKCGIKASMKKGAEVKVEVHHVKGIKCWDEIIDKIMDELLCGQEELQTLCRDCHEKETNGKI